MTKSDRKGENVEVCEKLKSRLIFLKYVYIMIRKYKHRYILWKSNKVYSCDDGERGSKDMNQQKEKSTVTNKVLTVIGTVLCLILAPILIINCILIVKSFTSEEVPSLAGTLPLIVLTDSMYPVIESGDLIICHTAEPEEIEVGDMIAFFDPAGNGSSIVTHRVLEVTEENGGIAWRTKGDNNNTEDRLLVPADKLVAVYEGTRLPGVGNVAIFMQTTPGMILCCVCPALLMVGWDMIRRKKYEKAKQQDTDALLAELEELRRMKAEKEQA